MKLYSNSSDKVLNGKVLFVATQKGNEGKVYKVIFNEMSGLSSGKITGIYRIWNHQRHVL